MKNIKYSYFYPHKDPFPLKIKVTNKSGSRTFSYNVKGNEYSNVQKSYIMQYMERHGKIDIRPLPNNDNINRIDGYDLSTKESFTLKPFTTSDNKLNNVKVEFPELFGGQLAVGYAYGNNNAFTAVGFYNLQTSKNIGVTLI